MSRSTFLFRALMALWLLLAPLSMRFYSQDGAGYVTAGDLVLEGRDDLVYAGPVDELWITEPTTLAKICEASPEGTDCRVFVRFVSTPPALPFVAGYALAGFDVGLLLWRATLAGALVWGMTLLRDRLRDTEHGSGTALATAALLTPAAHYIVVQGQTSAAMFLAVAIGVTGAASKGARRWGMVAATTLATVTKVLPGVTVIPLALLGARRAAAWTVAVIVVASAAVTAIAGPGIWADYVDLSLAFSEGTADLDTSAAVSRWIPLPVAVAAVAAFGAALWRRRDAVSPDLAYASCWVAAVALTPFLWAHYLWVCAAALAITLADHGTALARWALVGFAGAAFVLYAVDASETVTWWRPLTCAVAAGAILHAAYTSARPARALEVS